MTDQYWNESSPEWATVVVYDATLNGLFYLSSSAPEDWEYFQEVGSDSVGLTMWEKGPTDLIVSYRPDTYHTLADLQKSAPEESPRPLTEVEAEILEDLGLLDYAIETGAVQPPEEEQGDTRLHLTVVDVDNEKLVYEFVEGEDEGDEMFHVSHFAKAMMEAYEALGFKNKMEISFYTMMTNPLHYEIHPD